MLQGKYSLTLLTYLMCMHLNVVKQIASLDNLQSSVSASPVPLVHSTLSKRPACMQTSLKDAWLVLLAGGCAAS